MTSYKPRMVINYANTGRPYIGCKYGANKARCKHCGTVVESKHRHDWVACGCFRNEPGTSGFYLDGGDDYCRVGGNLEDVEWLT